MIIVGYQGIGKSTLSRKSNNFIDLESSNFWVDGVRADNWYIPYCNIANHLSGQGFNVFTSSHKVVTDALKEITSESGQRVVVIVPSPKLKNEWLEKLKERYTQIPSEKNKKALLNAEDRFTENVTELAGTGFPTIVIDDIDYDLSCILSDYIGLIRNISSDKKPYSVHYTNVNIRFGNAFDNVVSGKIPDDDETVIE